MVWPKMTWRSPLRSSLAILRTTSARGMVERGPTQSNVLLGLSVLLSVAILVRFRRRGRCPFSARVLWFNVLIIHDVSSLRVKCPAGPWTLSGRWRKMVNVSWTRRKRRLILEVRLEDEVVEVRAESPLLARSPKVDLRRTTQVIRRAALDRRVSGLILRLAHPEVGWAKAASLARAIRVFRSAGKPVVGFLEGAGNLDYALACACQILIMHPGATLDLVGLQAEAFFFKDLLDRFGIEAELDAIGEYKTAGEPFVRREMSAEHREALRGVLSDLSDQLESAIAEGRALSTERVREIFEGGPYLAEEARELGLVDHVDHEDACESWFREKLGFDVIVQPHTDIRRVRGGCGAC